MVEMDFSNCVDCCCCRMRTSSCTINQRLISVGNMKDEAPSPNNPPSLLPSLLRLTQERLLFSKGAFLM